MSERDLGWQKRQDEIRSTLANRTVRSQSELIGLLRRRGFDTTQSSLSRDLAELHAAKIDGRYVIPATLPESESAPRTWSKLHDLVRGVRPGGPHLLVMFTNPGAASVVAQWIDKERWPEVVGTVAGDDTLLIITQGKRDQAVLLARFERSAGGKTRG